MKKYFEIVKQFFDPNDKNLSKVETQIEKDFNRNFEQLDDWHEDYDN